MRGPASTRTAVTPSLGEQRPKAGARVLGERLAAAAVGDADDVREAVVGAGSVGGLRLHLLRERLDGGAYDFGLRLPALLGEATQEPFGLRVEADGGRHDPEVCVLQDCSTRSPTRQRRPGAAPAAGADVADSLLRLEPLEVRVIEDRASHPSAVPPGVAYGVGDRSGEPGDEGSRRVAV